MITENTPLNLKLLPTRLLRAGGLSISEGTLRIVNEVEIAEIQNHLRIQKTGVKLDQNGLPQLNDGFWCGYKVILDNEDFDKVILWWENRDHTINRTCRIADLLPSVKNLLRVQSFISGNDAKRLNPIDLRSTNGMELCAVTDSINGDFLYVIDGNNRLIAHWLQTRSLGGVPSYVAVHDGLKNWAYIPDYWQMKWKS